MPVERGDNLHFIIDGLGGVVQIGKCCILLRITFDDTIAKKLLTNGEMALTLSSGDVLVEVNWSDWEARRKEIKSKIKVDIIASLEEVRDAAENEILKELLSETDQYKTLRLVIKMLYERFYAVVYKVMGGCIELWIANETLQQAYHLQDRRLQVEEFLSGILIRGQKHVRLSVSVMLDFVHGTDKSTNNLPRFPKDKGQNGNTDTKELPSPEKLKAIIETQIEASRKEHQDLISSRLGYQPISGEVESESTYFSSRQLAYVDKTEFITRVNNLADKCIGTVVTRHSQGTQDVDILARLQTCSGSELQKAKTKLLETVQFLTSDFAFNIGIEEFEDILLPEFQTMFDDLLALVVSDSHLAQADDENIKRRSGMLVWKCRLFLENYFYRHLKSTRDKTNL